MAIAKATKNNSQGFEVSPGSRFLEKESGRELAASTSEAVVTLVLLSVFLVFGNEVDFFLAAATGKVMVLALFGVAVALHFQPLFVLLYDWLAGALVKETELTIFPSGCSNSNPSSSLFKIILVSGLVKTI